MGFQELIKEVNLGRLIALYRWQVADVGGYCEEQLCRFVTAHYEALK
jgi:hypothetical protein